MPGGGLANRRVLAVIEPGIPDGLRVDSEGNIWTSARDGVHCLAPDGALDDSIHAPRARSRFFYDESDPASLLAAMETARQRLVN